MSRVTDFGAQGDGVADDTEAIEHALAEGEGVLELPRGTYRLTRTVVLDLTRLGPLGLRGEQGTARVVMAGPGPAFRIVGDHQGTAQPESVQDHTWTRERFPLVSGLEIVGEHPEAVGITLDHTMQATVTNMLIRRCRVGIHLVERNRNFLLSDCHIYENSHYGVFLDRVNLHQINIIGNHISYNKRAGIKSRDGDIHNLQITGNDIEYNHDEDSEGSADIDFEAPDGIISEVTIASNTIQARPSPGGANVRVVGGGDAAFPNARLIAVTGNVLGSQSINIHLRHAQRVAVAGNTIYDGHELGVLAQHCEGLAISGNTHGWSYRPDRGVIDGLRLEDCAGCVITGQTMKDCLAGDDDRGGCITLVRCRDSAVTDCLIRDPGRRGIWLEDSQRCRIVGNTVTDEHQPRRLIVALRVTGDTSRNNLLQGNLVESGTQGAIECPPSAGQVQGNMIIS